MVAIGKAALANKNWPEKAAEGDSMEECVQESFFVPNAKFKDFEL